MLVTRNVSNYVFQCFDINRYKTVDFTNITLTGIDFREFSFPDETVSLKPSICTDFQENPSASTLH